MVSVQKVSFRGDLFNQINMPTKVVTQPQQVVSAVQTSYEPTTISSAKPSTKGVSFNGNNAIAIASAVVSTVAIGLGVTLALKNGKLIQQLQNVTQENSRAIRSVTDNLAATVSDVTTKLDGKLSEMATTIEESSQKLKKKISGLGKWQDGQISGVREDLARQISAVRSEKAGSLSEILTASCKIGEKELNLATVLNGYGKNEDKLTKILQSESAKNIFGIVDRSHHVPKDSITLRMPTSEFKGFASTGGMSAVPREVIANLGAMVNNKQKVRLVVDMPMYMGQIEDNIYYSLQKRVDGLYDYVTSKGEKPFVEGMEKIGSMRLPIYTDKGKTSEVVDMFLARDIEQVVDLDLLKPWLTKDLQKELKKAEKTGNAFEFNWNALKIKYNPDKGDIKPVARVKYDTVFYHNDKFNMNGPVEAGKVKNIYNNLTHNAGETERFVYFDKYFYEGLLREREFSTEKLGADVIIGNDWQTGAISAMMKLLTQARKYSGLDPKIADKVYNTPIVTIIHNAGLAGDVWHSQEKLLNVMFGEHSHMIVRNAHMPKNVGLNPESWNGLFHGNNLNPQTMASVYSDVLIPVSKGYGHEMATQSGFGCANHAIFNLRAREGKFANIERLKIIAEDNNLNPNLISRVNTAYRPITNGCDRVNNMLTPKNALKLQRDLGVEVGTLRAKLASESVFDYHQYNKEGYLNKVIADINSARAGKGNPMNIELPEMTDLTGVTKDTVVFSTAGRIVDQKGLDIWAESIEEFLTRHHGKGGDTPVFYTQGIGDNAYIDKLLDVKRRIADKFGQEAANRIVFAKLFSEPGRYDGCKLMSDFTIMSSWFEPCGLVHKEIAAYSGAIPIVNKVGGLTDGLEHGVNAIFSEFKPKFENYDEALKYNRKVFTDAMDEAYKLFQDKPKFKEVLENSYNANHSWLKKGGAMEEYAKVLVDLKVLKPEVLKAN